MFRCQNHRLPIEAGVRSQVLRDMRVCQFCKTDIGDEFDYLLCCVHFKEENIKRQNTIYDLQLFTFKNFLNRQRAKSLNDWLFLPK